MSGLSIVGVPWEVHPENRVNAVPEGFDAHDHPNYTLLSRIGSQSMNGRVYEVKNHLDQSRIALKLMSVGHEGECRRATLLGEACPRYFPRVISWTTCPNVVVKAAEDEKHSDVFVEFAEREFVKKYVLDHIPGSDLYKKRLGVLMKKIHTSGAELLQDLRGVGVPESMLLQSKEQGGIEMTVMASELAYGDLMVLVKDDPHNEEIPRLVGEVFEAMEWLVRERIVHEDLHLGNILLRSDSRGRLSAVIHDFGESTEDRCPYEHTRDICKFLDALGALVHSEYGSVVSSARDSVDSFVQDNEAREITRDGMIDFLKKLQGIFGSM